jgi:Protein of unknown function DUF262
MRIMTIKDQASAVEQHELNDEDTLLERLTGVEAEDQIGDDGIIHPFNPTQIKIDTRSLTVDLLLKRLEHKELILNPDFQRGDNLWTPAQQSRLIESFLIRIPIPVFYFDASDDEKWVVIDGLQRLTTLKNFCLDKSLRLSGLEFLTEFVGKSYDDLDRGLQRRINETQITASLVQPGTPPDVKFKIFARINTGGLPLSAQEIRHALYQGKATTLLKELAETEEFRAATAGGVPDVRMDARECVLRFFSFRMHSYRDYAQYADLDRWLIQTMESLNSKTETELKQLKADFKRAMRSAEQIFEGKAFRKQFRGNTRRFQVSKPLFEAWAVNLAQRSDGEIETLVARKQVLVDDFIALLELKEFNSAISSSTGNVKNVTLRFESIRDLIEDSLNA